MTATHSDSVTLADIEAAAQRLSGQMVATPFLHSRTLSAITGCELWLKFENLQFTSSFKERGALNKLLLLSAAERAAGVVAASAGNHAQGVAYHAQRLGIRATIVMPRLTPTVKVEGTRRLGANIVLYGDGFDEAKAHALALARSDGFTFIHAYDDPHIIAGQGTLGLEMVAQGPPLDALVISVGGGGLIGGIAVAMRALNPQVQIIGVQTQRYASMFGAIKALNMHMGPSTIAEGIAVKQPGALTQAIVQRDVDDIVLVDEGDIEQAIVLLLDIEKTVVEGAGAAGLAAVVHDRARFAGQRVGLVLSGGNIDPLLLADIIERGLVRSGRLTRLTVQARDIPGALSQLTALIAAQGANIEEVHHQRAFTSLPVQSVEIDFVLQTRGKEHIAQVIAALEKAGFVVQQH